MDNCKVTIWRGYCFDDKTEENIDFVKKDLLLKGDINENTSLLNVPSIEHHCHDVKSIINCILEEGENVDRFGSRKAKYVCGDTIGADFYATRGGKGIVAEAKVDIDRIVIDGRDLLYYAIPKIINTGTSDKTKVLLIKAFGRKINDYLYFGTKLKDLPSSKLFRFVDYFCMDFDIIKSNLESKVLIKGRYRTQFKSAFGVIDGIKPEEIVNIIEPGSNINIDYEDILSIDSI